MVRSYNDSAKRLARVKLREYIGKYLLNGRNPKNIRVACFPGAEVKGEEALEIREVYRPLGIPNENIVGIEYNSENAQRLQDAGLGIRVVEKDAYDYFKKTKDVFDVISLDYTGQRTWKEEDITRFICGRKVLADNGVYCTNHMIKREGGNAKKKMLYGLMFTGYSGKLFDELKDGMSYSEIETFLNVNEQVAKQDYDRLKIDLSKRLIDLSKLRNYITLGNVVIMNGGILEYDPRKHMFKGNDAINRQIKGYEDLRDKDRKGIAAEIENYSAIRAVCGLAFNTTIYEVRKRGYDKDFAKKLVQIMTMGGHGGRVPTNIERYTYTSNKNANMLFDIIQSKSISRKAVKLSENFISVNGRGYVEIEEFDINNGKMIDAIIKLNKIVPGKLQAKIFNPEYLGSSWVPKKRLEKISKVDAVELLSGGVSPFEITECYRGFTLRQLAAFKAHYVTMGKKLR